MEILIYAAGILTGAALITLGQLLERRKRGNEETPAEPSEMEKRMQEQWERLQRYDGRAQ